MFSARDASIRYLNDDDEDDNDHNNRAAVSPKRPVEATTQSKKKSKRDEGKRLTVRLYADALAEQEQKTAAHDAAERRKSRQLEAIRDDAQFVNSPEAKAVKAASDSKASAAQSERQRKETWNVLDDLIVEETHKRHTLIVRERTEYHHGENNDVDLPLALDALCVMSLCLQRDPIPFDTLQVAHIQLSKELAKFCNDIKRAYYEPSVTRNRYGIAAAQTGKRKLAEAVRDALDRTDRLRERITKCEKQAATTLSDEALAGVSEHEARSAKLVVRQPLLQAVQLHWDDMRTLLDAIHPQTPMARLTQLRDALQDILDEALHSALSVVRETSEPCEPADVERVADSVTRAMFNAVGFASLMTRCAIGIGELTRLRGMSDNLWLLVKGARMLALLSIDLASGSDDAIEQQRLALSLKQLVHGMARRLDTILEAVPGENETIEYYTVNDELRTYCENELRASVVELEQANELLAVQTTASPNAPLFDTVAALARRVVAYDALLVSISPPELVKHTRRIGSDIELVASRLVTIALRANAFPVYKDALFDAIQAAAHCAMQLRVLGGARALDYNVVIYHGVLVMLCRQLCGALAAALQVCSALATIGAPEVLQAREGDAAVLPHVLAYAVQYVGAELGRQKVAADSVSTAVRSNLNVDALLLDVARSATENEVRKLEEERRAAAAQRREQERVQSQAALLADLDETAADVAAEIDDVGPEPPKPIGFDENQHYTAEVHGDYREWAKQKYNYTEWQRKKNLRDGQKQQLTSAQKRASLIISPSQKQQVKTPRDDNDSDDDDNDAPRAPPPVHNLAAQSASTVTRATLRGAEAAAIEAPPPQKPETLKPGATSDEYKAFMKAKFYYEEYQNKMALAEKKKREGK